MAQSLSPPQSSVESGAEEKKLRRENLELRTQVVALTKAALANADKLAELRAQLAKSVHLDPEAERRILKKKQQTDLLLRQAQNERYKVRKLLDSANEKRNEAHRITLALNDRNEAVLKAEAALKEKRDKLAAENEVLLKQLETKNQEITDLKQQLEEVNRQVQTLSADVFPRGQIAMENRRKTPEQIEKENEDLKLAIKRLEEQLKNSQPTIDQLQRKVQEFAEYATQVAKAEQEYKDYIAALQSQLAKEKEELQKEAERLRKEEQAKAEQQLKDEKAKLEKQFAEEKAKYEAQIAQKNGELEEAQALIERNRHTIAQLQNEAKNLAAAPPPSEAKLKTEIEERHNQQLENLRTTLLEEGARERKAALEKLQKELGAKFQQELTALRGQAAAESKQQIEALEQRIKSLIDENAALTKMSAELRDQVIPKINGARIAAETELQAITVRFNQLNAKYHDLVHALRHRERIIPESQQSVTPLYGSTGEAKIEITDQLLEVKIHALTDEELKKTFGAFPDHPSRCPPLACFLNYLDKLTSTATPPWILLTAVMTGTALAAKKWNELPSADKMFMGGTESEQYYADQPDIAKREATALSVGTTLFYLTGEIFFPQATFALAKIHIAAQTIWASLSLIGFARRIWNMASASDKANAAFRSLFCDEHGFSFKVTMTNAIPLLTWIATSQISIDPKRVILNPSGAADSLNPCPATAETLGCFVEYIHEVGPELGTAAVQQILKVAATYAIPTALAGMTSFISWAYDKCRKKPEEEKDYTFYIAGFTDENKDAFQLLEEGRGRGTMQSMSSVSSSQAASTFFSSGTLSVGVGNESSDGTLSATPFSESSSAMLQEAKAKEKQDSSTEPLLGSSRTPSDSPA